MGLFDFLKPKKKNGINSDLFNSNQYQLEILALAEMFYNESQDYDIVADKLKKENLSDEQAALVIQKHKDFTMRNFKAGLDNGTVKIQVTPNDEHTAENTDAEQVDRYIAYGCFQMDRGEFENARELFDKALQLDPGAALAYANKGSLMHRMGFPKEALELYNKATSLNEKDARIWVSKGSLQQEMGNIAGALDSFKNALKYDPADIIALNNAGICYAQLEDYSKALDHFEQVIAFEPNDDEATINKIGALMNLGREDEAHSIYRLMASRHPKNLDLHYSIPHHYYYKDPNKAAAFFDRQLKQTGNTEYIRLKGYFFFDKDAAVSLTAFNKFLSLFPHDGDAHSHKMRLLAKDTHNPDAFEEAVEACFTVNPDNYTALFYKTQLLYRNNEKEQALSLAEKLCNLYPTNVEAAELYIDVISYIKERAEVEAAFEKLKRINPNEAYNLEYKKGLYYKMKGYYDEAISLFQKQNDLYEFAWNYYQTGIIYNLLGDTEKALQYLEKTFELDASLKEDAKQYHELLNLHQNNDFRKLTGLQ